MIQPMPSVALSPVPADVLRFTTEQGASPYLYPVMELAQGIFPEAAGACVSGSRPGDR